MGNNTIMKKLYYIITGISLLALIFIVVTWWLAQSIGAPTSQTIGANLTSNDVYSAKMKTLPDPLITTVPKDQQSAEEKTKVFISSVDPLLGSNSAQVFVILYGSLTDNTTQTYLALVDGLEKKYGSDKVAVAWKDYAVDDFSQTTAVIAHCANDFGKFWQFAQAVPNRSADTSDALLDVAVSIGLNKLDIQDCIDQKGYSAQVQQSYYTGQQLGVTNGHNLFINDRLYTNKVKQSDIEQSIDEILASY